MNYDKIITLAKNDKGDVLSAVKWGKVWRYVVEYHKQDQFETGLPFTTQRDILSNAASFALSDLCGCFTVADLEPCVLQATKTDGVSNQVRIDGVNEIRRYLNSSKFGEDVMVNKNDILMRLNEIDTAVFEVESELGD